MDHDQILSHRGSDEAARHSALTLPFCLATLAFLPLRDGGGPVVAVPLAEITTPEAHARRRGRDAG